MHLRLGMVVGIAAYLALVCVSKVASADVLSPGVALALYSVTRKCGSEWV